MSKINNDISKKDIDRIFFRWITRAQSCWNYETMQGLGYCATMLPFLKKKYQGEELKEMVKLHMNFFNTNVVTGGFVIGADMAIENELGYESKEMIPAIKTGLMGPLAGVGDTFFTVTINTVLGSIATYMALEGNPIGIILWLIGSLVKIAFSRWFTHLAFKEGRRAVSQVSGKLKKVTDASTLLGMMVIGALIPKVVSVKTKLEPVIGDMTVNIQEQIFDAMMPCLLPVLLVGFVYWLLGRKGMNSTKAIFIVILIAIVCNYFGILGLA